MFMCVCVHLNEYCTGLICPASWGGGGVDGGRHDGSDAEIMNTNSGFNMFWYVLHVFICLLEIFC